MAEQIQSADNSILESVIRGGGTGARQAFEELDGRALGGNAEAQRLINRFDNEISTGILTLPAEKAKIETKSTSLLSKFKNVFGQQSQTGYLRPPDRDP